MGLLVSWQAQPSCYEPLSVAKGLNILSVLFSSLMFWLKVLHTFFFYVCVVYGPMFYCIVFSLYLFVYLFQYTD